jgi:hypothetical protein
LPRSRFLDELAQGPLPAGVEVHTIAAARDWVCPLPSTRLIGAKTMTVPLGHSSLVVSEEVYARLKNILRRRQQPSATDRVELASVPDQQPAPQSQEEPEDDDLETPAALSRTGGHK